MDWIGCWSAKAKKNESEYMRIFMSVFDFRFSQETQE